MIVHDGAVRPRPASRTIVADWIARVTSRGARRPAARARGRDARGARARPLPGLADPARVRRPRGRRRRARRPLLHARAPRRRRRDRASRASTRTRSPRACSREVDGAVDAHVLLVPDRRDARPPRARSTATRCSPAARDAQREQVALATDSSDWLELLDTDLLPRNYAAVLARCELGRERLGPARRPGRGSTRSWPAPPAVLGENPRHFLDDSNHRVGRYDIYTADVWLFCEPLAAAARPAVGGGAAHRARPRARGRVARRHRGAVGPVDRRARRRAHRRARRARARGRVRRRARPGLAPARGRRDARRSQRGFDADGVSNAHRHRDQDQYRGPARRLQLTLDLLGKIAWAAATLDRAPGRRCRGDARRGVPARRPVDRLRGPPRRRACGRTAAPGADFVVPFVGASRSHYLPAPYQPGTWEVPVDQDLPCWTPLVARRARSLHRGRRPRGDAPRGRRAHRALGGARAVGREPRLAPKDGTPLAATRNLRLAVERRTLVLDDELTFERGARRASASRSPRSRAGRCTSSGRCATPHATTRITVDGLAEWRSPWSEIAAVHQLDCEPATRARRTGRGSRRCCASARPRSATTTTRRCTRRCATGSSSGRRRSAGRPPPDARLDDDRPAARALARVGRVRRPRRARGDPRAACASTGVPIVWTAHNLTPHERRPEVYDPIYAAWAREADGGDPPQRVGRGADARPLPVRRRAAGTR